MIMNSSHNSSSIGTGGWSPNFKNPSGVYYSDYDLTGIQCPAWPWFGYYIGGIATTVLCTFAMFGNIVCIIVLSRPAMKSSVNCILLVMSCSDLVQVTATLLMRGIQRICEYHCVGVVYTFWIQPIITPYIFPIGTTAQVASIYLTVLVSVERYVAVCQPFKVRIWFSWRKSFLFCLTVISFSLLYNLPTWFELETRAKFNLGQFLGLAIRRSALYRDPAYVFYYVNLGSFIVIRLVPFTLLVVLNGSIYKTLYQMNKTRATLTQLQCHEVSVARMLLCIVSIFLLCNLASIVGNMLEAFQVSWPPLLASAANFLLLLNAASNFIIYCFMSQKFRRVLLHLLCKNQEYNCSAQRNGTSGSERFFPRSSLMSTMHRSPQPTSVAPLARLPQ